MKLRQGRYMVFVRRIGVFANFVNPYNYTDANWAYMRLKEAKAIYPWLVRKCRVSFEPLMIDPVRVVNDQPSVFWRQTRHSEKIRLNRLSRRRNRQHINDEDYDFRQVRINRWIVE